MIDTKLDAVKDADLLAHMRRRGFLRNDRAGWCAETRERVEARCGYTRDGNVYSRLVAGHIADEELEDAERARRVNNTPDEEL
jgi:hypothetical protein